ncbi:MAG: SAM-dependent methyltransferase [Alistipes sp.]|nr:SAM-dependent methyltransferase [Alistipes sp.]
MRRSDRRTGRPRKHGKRQNSKGMPYGTIYMLPTPIGDRPVYDVLPEYNRAVMARLDYFIVENERTARRFLSRAGIGKPIDGLRIAELNEHTTPEQVAELLAPVLGGADAGVLSEAGLPGVADPGADLTALAHRHGIRVTPLVGPSSILLALMASGLNGQSFAFNGYLPVKHPERGQAIRRLEQRARTEGQSQLFIETPYRNLRLFDELTSLCADDTLLTVAADILQPDELIRTAPVRQWRGHAPDIHKRPAIFIVGTQAPPEKRGIGAPDRKERSARRRSR